MDLTVSSTDRKRKAEEELEPVSGQEAKKPLLEEDAHRDALPESNGAVDEQKSSAQPEEADVALNTAVVSESITVQDNDNKDQAKRVDTDNNNNNIPAVQPSSTTAGTTTANTTTSTTGTSAAAQAPASTKAEVTVKPQPPVDTVIPFDRLIVLNVAATCDDNTSTPPGALHVTKENSEVIELSYVVIDASKMVVIHTEQIYVKPERTPLTEYCTQVTGITADMLESAGTLEDAIKRLDEYIRKEMEGKSFCFVTHGGWTLRIQLPREARDKGIELPSYLAFCRMFDVKQEIQRWQVHHPEVSLRSTSLKELCETFHVDRVTDQSAGLNTCLTTVNVMRYLTGFRHPDVFVHPIDTNADLQQFKKEESKVVHLAGLPYEVTQGELEAWFSSNGLRPTMTWMIQPTDYSKPSLSGFVVFHAHNDAMRALSLNGRCLGDRAIEVSPSSERVIEAAGSMLAPFPVQPKSRPLRPGDWNCPSCGFHNFASRRNCFKCNTESPNVAPPPAAAAAAPSPIPAPPPAPTHPPVSNFAAGDWICPNYSCGFHNYASRLQCFKCGTYRPQGGDSGSSGSSSHAPPPPLPPPGYGRPHHNITFRPGDWYCPNPACNFQNFASRATCFRCHTPSPTPPQRPPYQPPVYGYSSSEPGYGAAGPNVYGQSSYQAPPSNSYGYGPPSGAPFRPGDWYCPSCSAHNFASRIQCLKCGTGKPQHSAPPTAYPPANLGMKRRV